MRDGNLLGMGHPCAADIADDGSIYVLMSETRAEEPTDEAPAFRRSAF